MKQSASSDFTIGVSAERAEHDESCAANYDGIYVAILNELVWVSFVPKFHRDPWPPSLPADVDRSSNADEARRTCVALATYSVTPDERRASSSESFTLDNDVCTVFYVTEHEYDELASDLASLAERFGPLHSPNTISMIAKLGAPNLQRFLLERVVVSERLTADDLEDLGRGKHAS